MRLRGILGLFAFLVWAMSSGSLAWAAGGEEVAGLRRLSEQEYRNSIADIFGKDIVIQGMFEPEVRMGGLVAASTAVLSMTQPGFESFSKMADSIAVQVTGEKLRSKLVSCIPKSPKDPDDTCAADFFSHYGLMLFRRPLTAAELKGRVSLANAMTKSSGDFYAGLRYGRATL